MSTINNATVASLRDPSNWHTERRDGRYIIQFKNKDAFERKQSVIPVAGQGLFTLQPLRKNKTFTVYTGRDIGPFTNEFVTSKAYRRLRCLVPDGDYMMAVDGRVVDGYRGFTGAQFINDANGGPGRTMTAAQRRAAGLWAGRRPAYNARISADGKGSIRTKGRPVKVGEELFMDYGTSYWTKFNRERDCAEFAEETTRQSTQKKQTKQTKVQKKRMKRPRSEAKFIVRDGQRWRKSKRLRDSRGRRILIQAD
jgi:hypothetical protein